jgi:hypothetical protein
VDQSKFETLTKVLVTEGPRRGFLGAIAGGTLGLLLGVGAEDAEAGPRRRAKKKKGKNRCRGVDRICEPFEAGKCCSKRCCPALGAKGRRVSVCAPKRASQCCPVSYGGGYCDRTDHKVCCKPTGLSPDGYCCRQGSTCSNGEDFGQDTDYCCPFGSHACTLTESPTGCCRDTVAVATGVSATSTVARYAAGGKAG